MSPMTRCSATEDPMTQKGRALVRLFPLLYVTGKESQVLRYDTTPILP